MLKGYITENKKQTQDFAKQVLQELQVKKTNIVLLRGELGAGKTTFAQGLLKAAGAKGPFTSPTFVIMKEYALENQKSGYTAAYHLDCYRVGARDVLDLGWEEIIADKDNLVILEWPERIQKILPDHRVELRFSITGESKREIVISEK